MTFLMRRLAALVVLLAGTVGLPIGLLFFGRSLIPSAAPSWEQIWTALTARDDGHLLAGLLLLIGLIAWIIFLLCVLSEIGTRSLRRPAIRLPGLRLPQALAGSLISMVLAGSVTIGGATNAYAGGMPALPDAPLAVVTASTTVTSATSEPGIRSWIESAVIVANEAPVVSASALPEWTVRKGDTLWAIAERTLGDPLRYTDIAALNVGTRQADGHTMTSAEWLQPGWILALPADADTSPTSSTTPPIDVAVTRGDTLSKIAIEHGSSTAAVWAANAGRVEPGGATLVDPDRIYPGWTITIPANSDLDVASADRSVNQSTEPSGAPVSEPPTEAGQLGSPSTGSVSAPVEEAAQPTTDTPSRDQVEPPVSTPLPAETTTNGVGAAPSTGSLTATTSASAANAQPASSPAHDSEWALILASSGAALLAGGVYASWRRLQRRGARRRRSGRTFPPTAVELIPMAKVIATAGRAGYLDVTFLDGALRSLSMLCVKADIPIPDVIAARLSETELGLILHSPALVVPTPWTVTDDGLTWTLQRTHLPAASAAGTNRSVAPFPALVSVAHTDDHHWLIDLERIGTAALTGDSGRCRLLARHIATELGHNIWSEMLQVTLVGWGGEMAELSPGRLTVGDSPERTIASATAQRQDLSATSMGALEGRRDDVTTDAWAPQVLIVDPTKLPADNTSLGVLGALIDNADGAERSTIAMLLIDNQGDSIAVRWQIEVDVHGTLRIPELGLEATAEQLPADEARQLGQLLRATADTQDQPAPHSPGDQPVDALSDSLGSLLPAPGVVRDRADIANTEDSDQVTSVLPMPSSAYTATAAVTADELDALAPMVSREARNRIEQADQALDADLADWYDPTCKRPKISVLGPVDVLCQGPLPTASPQHAMHVEVATYLATRPRGATVLQFAQAIWSDDANIFDQDGKFKPKVRRIISSTRKWLGEDPKTRRPYLPLVAGSRDAVYRLEGVLLDADLFRRLRVRGCARNGDAGIADLAAALRLVTGRPFDCRRSEGYGWLVDNRLDEDYLWMITDVAQIVAAHYLQAGDPVKAIEASEVALFAGDVSDKSLLNIYRAHKDMDDEAGAARQYQKLLDKHDVDDEVELPPDTFAILHGSQWRVGHAGYQSHGVVQTHV